MTDSQRLRRIEWDPRDYSTQDRVNHCTELREQIQSGQFNQIEVFSYHECAGEARRGLNGEPEFDTAPLAWLLYNPHFRRVQFFSKSKTFIDGQGWHWDRAGRRYHTEWQGSLAQPAGCSRGGVPIWFKFSFGGEASTDVGYPRRTIWLHEYDGLPGSYKAYVQSLGDPLRLYPHAHMTKVRRESHLDMWANLLLDAMMSPPFINTDWYRVRHGIRFPNVPLLSHSFP